MNINNRREPRFDEVFAFVFNLSANEAAFYASLIGIVLAQDLTITEQNDLGNFLMLIAQEIITMGAHNNLVETRHQKEKYELYQSKSYH